MNATNRFLALTLCCLPLAAAAQQIYRWVDANGVQHFTQNPPAQGSYETVTPNLPPANPAYKSPYQEQAAPRPGPAAEHAQQQAMQQQADNAERCAKARERIAFLQDKTAHRLFVTGTDGQPARMTDEQFTTEVQDAQDAAAKYCQ